MADQQANIDSAMAEVADQAQKATDFAQRYDSGSNRPTNADLRNLAQGLAQAAGDLNKAISTLPTPVTTDQGDPAVIAMRLLEAAEILGDDCVALWGYLDDAPDMSGQVHLYLSTDGDEYLLIDNADIVVTIPRYSQSQPLAGSTVWVKERAKIKRVIEDVALQEGRFLSGAITLDYQSQYTGAPLVRTADLIRQQADPTSGGGCGTGAVFGCT